ncbi:MAG: hypothetical protein HUU01_16885 [Saprospiraceae bacterium]|nr:hypothetical protein [Saprospiraceae bacterium]
MIRYIADKAERNKYSYGAVHQALVDFTPLPGRQLNTLKDNLKKSTPKGSFAGLVPASAITGNADYSLSNFSPASSLETTFIPPSKAIVSLHLDSASARRPVLDSTWQRNEPVLPQLRLRYHFEAMASFTARLPWDSIQTSLLKGEVLSAEKIKSWLSAKIVTLKNLKGEALALYEWELDPIADLLQSRINQRQDYFPTLDDARHWKLQILNARLSLHCEVKPTTANPLQPKIKRIALMQVIVPALFRYREVFGTIDRLLLDIHESSFDLNINSRVRLKLKKHPGFFVFNEEFLLSKVAVSGLRLPAITYPLFQGDYSMAYEQQAIFQFKDEKYPWINKTTWVNQNTLMFNLYSNRRRHSVDIEYEPKQMIELGIQGIKLDLLLVQEKQTTTLKKVFFLPAMEKQEFSLQNVQIFLPDENKYTYHYRTTWYFRSGQVVEDPLKETDHSYIYLELSKNITSEKGQKKE